MPRTIVNPQIGLTVFCTGYHGQLGTTDHARAGEKLRVRSSVFCVFVCVCVCVCVDSDFVVTRPTRPERTLCINLFKSRLWCQGVFPWKRLWGRPCGSLGTSGTPSPRRNGGTRQEPQRGLSKLQSFASHCFLHCFKCSFLSLVSPASPVSLHCSWTCQNTEEVKATQVTQGRKKSVMLVASPRSVQNRSQLHAATACFTKCLTCFKECCVCCVSAVIP